jgi:N-acetylmuramic acid 6-phosphate etherase
LKMGVRSFSLLPLFFIQKIMDHQSIPITEQENERTSNLDKLPTLDVIRLMNEEDARVAEVVKNILPYIAKAIDRVTERMRSGGRLYYVGTGTSGRLGVLDASECPPTFGVSPDLIRGIIAGGYEACHRAVEASEDDSSAGAEDLRTAGLESKDAVIGIAASGRTPYTIGALEYAGNIGAFTAAITCVPDSPITRACEVSMIAVVGPEVVTGSTRLKAGTAQKMILNMISTTAMVHLGFVTGNRMTNLQPRNTKLRDRSLRILMSEAGLNKEEAQAALIIAGNDLKIALVMIKAGCSRDEAQVALKASRNVIEEAVKLLPKKE